MSQEIEAVMYLSPRRVVIPHRIHFRTKGTEKIACGADFVRVTSTTGSITCQPCRRAVYEETGKKLGWGPKFEVEILASDATEQAGE